jgi:hypothetical protein
MGKLEGKIAVVTGGNIQRVLYKIDEEEELSHQSFLNINSVLSAIFTHARRSGTLQGPNPTDSVEIPEGKRNGVPTKTIAAILRHGSGSEVTERNYIDVYDATSVAALKNLPKKSLRRGRA